MKLIIFCLMWTTLVAQDPEVVSSRLDVIVHAPEANVQVEYRPRPQWTVAKLVTETQTQTVTQTVSSVSVDVSICAKIVNITGPCIRRRGRWIHEPSVLTFDDEMDDVDQLLHPTAVQSTDFESTTTAQLPDVGLAATDAIRSSMEREDAHYGRSASDGVKDFIKNVWREKPWKLATAVKLTTTVTETVTQTVTTTSVSVTYKTVFIQGCTPNPFPFPTCMSRRR